ncbi:MAG: LysM peptidoglycan-binding domain-containing protein [Planctomycetota bacterium]
MNNLEKYGVLALIFVIVLILTVAIWNGPGEPKPGVNPLSNIANLDGKPADGKIDVNLNPGSGIDISDPNIAARPALQEQIRRQQEENAKLLSQNNNTPANSGEVVPGGQSAGEGASLQKAPEFRKHKIVKGDTFESLALKYLGSRKLASEIQKANEGVLPTKMKLGMELLIPAAPADSLADSAKKDKDIQAAKKKATKPGKAAA